MNRRATVNARGVSDGCGLRLQSPDLLIVGCVEEDSSARLIFEQFPWDTQRLRSCLDLLLYVNDRVPRVVVCERDLPDGNWRDILEVALSLANPPPVIVTSRMADEYLWAEVLNLGGYDVLAKPFDRTEVKRTVNLAWEHWAGQREMAQRAAAVCAAKSS